jgi:hypothetical protein
MTTTGITPPGALQSARPHPRTRTPHLTERLLAVAAVLLCASVAACSSTQSQTAKSAASAPATAPTQASSVPETPASIPSVAAHGSVCGLVTVSEVAAATGKSMGPGTNAGTICSYSATADPSTVVYVQLYTDTQSMGAAKATETGSEHLTGLGDDAFWTAAGTIFVQKGTHGFTISTPSLALSSPNAPTAIITLANAALNRL